MARITALELVLYSWGRPLSMRDMPISGYRQASCWDGVIGDLLGEEGALGLVGGQGTGYSLELPSGWRDNPAISQAAQARVTAAQAAGLTLLVERYHYQGTPGCGLPVRPGRLEFSGRG